MPKGNPNRSPATRFSADNPGRAKQKGARDRLSAAFLNDFADDYNEYGKAVLEKVREKEPTQYLRICASLLPKEFDVWGCLEDLDSERMERAIEMLNAIIDAQDRAKDISAEIAVQETSDATAQVNGSFDALGIRN